MVDGPADAARAREEERVDRAGLDELQREDERGGGRALAEEVKLDLVRADEEAVRREGRVGASDAALRVGGERAEDRARRGLVDADDRVRRRR